MTVATDVISGSHTVVFEARVLETFQDGTDPEGTEIDVLDGDVTLDGTAEIRGQLDLRTPGTFGQDGPLSFPRGRSLLLGPYGNEIFVRYGIDLGATILWTPLGYYPIYSVDQGDADANPITLACNDRMAPIIDSDLIDPRSYDIGVTVGQVFDDLVLDIYPTAQIVFDDASGTSALGRAFIVEEHRYQALKELGDSLGKIVYWDVDGILRIETAPDPENIVWEVDAGKGGVQVNARRQLSRKGIYNAVIVEGEGADEQTPVRAVAVDANPTSPTRFGGPMGKIPKRLTTPLVTTNGQANTAAVQLLSRAIGAPYNVDFDAMTNPTLRPNEAIRITYRSGDRDVHLIDSVTFPLDEDKTMTAKTREKALIVIGSV